MQTCNYPDTVLILGFGSIGRRYARLLTGRVPHILVCDPAYNVTVAQEPHYHGINFYHTLDDLTTVPQAVLICTPNSDHLASLARVLAWQVPVFIEKPLCVAVTEQLDTLEAQIESKKIPTMVSCNMRFHPGLQIVRRMVQSQEFGRVLHFRFEFGFDLRQWRPWQDYRQSYSARKDLGGGILLDAIHEIDLAQSIFGSLQIEFLRNSNVGHLGIETEEIAELAVRCAGTLGTIHLDYLQHRYTRQAKVICEKGTIGWDFHANMVQVWRGQDEKDTVRSAAYQFNVDDMYTAQMDDFFLRVQKAEACQNPFSEAAGLIRELDRAKQHWGCV